MAETAYAKCDDLSIAYQVFGEGPVNLVFAGSFVSHIEVMWALPEFTSFFETLGAFARVLIFDKAGVGLSDPVPRVRSIEDRARELTAVMDAAGFQRAALMGISEGGPAAIVFAAARPDRVQGLILMGTFSNLPIEGWEDLDLSPEVALRRVVDAGQEAYLPTEAQIRRLQDFGRAVVDRWGKGEALGIILPSVRARTQLAMFERMAASPGMARATVEALFRVDVRPVLSAIAVPTLVIHAKDDFAPVQGGRYLADHIANATMLEISGQDHAPWMTEPQKVAGSIEEFLLGTRGAARPRRALRTVLFTDIVGSTEHAASSGDERWRSTLEQYDAATRRELERFDGTLIKSTGDGHLMTLEGPALAIRCALAIVAACRELGLEVRSGVHTGECELIGDDLGGIAVHIGARIMTLAGPGEVLVSSAVRDLVVGSGIGFDERGIHELKGVPGTWSLLAVRPDGAPVESSEASLVAIQTPSTRTAMRRYDRAIGVLARRTPRLLRLVGPLLLGPRRRNGSG